MGVHRILDRVPLPPLACAWVLNDRELDRRDRIPSSSHTVVHRVGRPWSGRGEGFSLGGDRREDWYTAPGTLVGVYTDAAHKRFGSLSFHSYRRGLSSGHRDSNDLEEGEKERERGRERNTYSFEKKILGNLGINLEERIEKRGSTCVTGSGALVSSTLQLFSTL